MNLDELLEPQQLVGAGPQGRVCTQLQADPGFNAVDAYTGRCQNCRRQLAAIQTLEGDSPGAGSSPNDRRQCSVAFGETCDLALGANLVPPLPGPWQLDAFPSGVHSRGEAHWTSPEYCSSFSLNEYTSLIIPPYCKPRIRNWVDLVMDFDVSEVLGSYAIFNDFFFHIKARTSFWYTICLKLQV